MYKSLGTRVNGRPQDTRDRLSARIRAVNTITSFRTLLNGIDIGARHKQIRMILLGFPRTPFMGTHVIFPRFPLNRIIAWSHVWSGVNYQERSTLSCSMKGAWRILNPIRQEKTTRLWIDDDTSCEGAWFNERPNRDQLTFQSIR